MVSVRQDGWYRGIVEFDILKVDFDEVDRRVVTD